MSEKFVIKWVDSGLYPQCPPNPAFPDGIDAVVVQDPAFPVCKVDLPYPAKRIGHYSVECTECGRKFGVTTAGRPDDPKSVTFNCKPKVH